LVWFGLGEISLVLDDTPGAFLIGMGRGTSSLILNVADFLLTTLMKLLNAFSWVAHTASLGTNRQLLLIIHNKRELFFPFTCIIHSIISLFHC
jgi:hypothetical protein